MTIYIRQPLSVLQISLVVLNWTTHFVNWKSWSQNRPITRFANLPKGSRSLRLQGQLRLHRHRRRRHRANGLELAGEVGIDCTSHYSLDSWLYPSWTLKKSDTFLENVSWLKTHLLTKFAFKVTQVAPALPEKACLLTCYSSHDSNSFIH